MTIAVFPLICLNVIQAQTTQTQLIAQSDSLPAILCFYIAI
jgi:hypothetical protein